LRRDNIGDKSHGRGQTEFLAQLLEAGFGFRAGEHALQRNARSAAAEALEEISFQHRHRVFRENFVFARFDILNLRELKVVK
jgi:hypothetical protein